LHAMATARLHDSVQEPPILIFREGIGFSFCSFFLRKSGTT